jgi:hypothetical protein
LEVAVTTLDTLDSPAPDGREVATAALAMADFDAKNGDFAAALEWLGVAELHVRLPAEYAAKRARWEYLRTAPNWRHRGTRQLRPPSRRHRWADVARRRSLRWEAGR